MQSNTRAHIQDSLQGAKGCSCCRSPRPGCFSLKEQVFLSRQESRFLEVQRPGQVVRVQLFRAGSNASLLPGPHRSPAPIDLKAILVTDGGEILGWEVRSMSVVMNTLM